MSKKVIILGAGVAGSTIAYLLARDGYDCTVIDKNNHVGGGVWTFFHGGHPYTEGPRPYYGWSKPIFEWLNKFVPMNPIELECYSYVEQENNFFSFPIHEDDISKLSCSEQVKKELNERDLNKKVNNLEEYWKTQVGPTLYNLFINKYSRKMWMVKSNTDFEQYEWSVKTNPIKSGKKSIDVECCAYPKAKDGYNAYFEKALEGSNVILNQKISSPDLEKKEIHLNHGEVIKGDIIISTISLDELMNEKYGKLAYTSRQFIPFVLPTKQVFPGNMMFAYYTQDEPCTRIVEYKKFTKHESDNTLLVMEIPVVDDNYKLYPYVSPKYIDQAKKYKDDLPKNVYSIGRLGSYQYSCIETTICQAFDLYKTITGKSEMGLENELYNPSTGVKQCSNDDNIKSN